MRRRKRANPVSLFSFQDIITGLCGVMIFVVLVQVVGIVLERDVGKSAASSAIDIDDEREVLKKEIAEFEKKLAAIKEKASFAVVAPKDRARQGDFEKMDKLSKELTEKERVVAALVSQVHDLETQVEKARNADAEDRARVREMERTRRLLEQKIASMKNLRGITLMPERGVSKIPVYMICTSNRIEVHRPFEKAPKTSLAVGDVQSGLADYLDSIDRTTHSVVLLVRPSGIKTMDMAVALLKSKRFTYGRDPLEEGVDVVFDSGGER